MYVLRLESLINNSEYLTSISIEFVVFYRNNLSARDIVEHSVPEDWQIDTFNLNLLIVLF